MKVLVEPGEFVKGVFLLNIYAWKGRRTTSPILLKGNVPALLDTGMRSSAPDLIKELRSRGVGGGDDLYILVSHRHPDHAGSASPLSKNFPRAILGLHKASVKHLLDPRRLNEGAREVLGEYGEAMDPLPEGREVITLKDGDIIDLGSGFEVEVVYTPGHTSDHLSFYERKTRLMYCGDAAGVLYPPLGRITPTAFYPSFKPHLYLQSLERMMGYDIDILAFAHYGAVLQGAEDILGKSLETTKEWIKVSEEVLKEGGDLHLLLRALEERFGDGPKTFPPRARRYIMRALARGLLEAFTK